MDRFDCGGQFFNLGSRANVGVGGNELMAWAGQNPKSYDDVKVGGDHSTFCSNELRANIEIMAPSVTGNTRIWDILASEC